MKVLLLGLETTSSLLVPNNSKVSANYNELYTEKFKLDSIKIFNLISSYPFQEINKVFNLPLFKNEKHKVIFFEEFKKSNPIYKKFYADVSHLLNSKSRRKKRALFGAQQRIELEKLLNELNYIKEDLETERIAAIAYGSVGAAGILTGAGMAISGVLAAAGPIGWLIGLGIGIAAISSVPTATAIGIGTNSHIRIAEIREKTKKLEELILIVNKSDWDFSLEENTRYEIINFIQNLYSLKNNHLTYKLNVDLQEIASYFHYKKSSY
ncbi:hypothetical protein ACW95P_03945 [Candidatus Mycoplasma pogonae]